MRALDAAQRRSLRQALLARYPWIEGPDVGPQAVEAGECDRCGAEARLVTTCGPTSWAGLGRRCAAEVGTAAWCDGHADAARAWLLQLAALPPEADAVARLWWVASGEVRLDPDAVALLRRAALPDATGGPRAGTARDPGTLGHARGGVEEA